MLPTRLKQIRLLRNLTQEYVAFEAGISQSQLSKYENGEHYPNIRMLHKIARALEVEVFELIYENDRVFEAAVTRWQSKRQK